MENCKICGVLCQNGYCDACEKDRQKVDTMANKDCAETVTWLLGLPSHLFFYALKRLLMVKDKNGITLNDHLLSNDRQNGDPIWLRLKGYRGCRGIPYQATAEGNNPFDRWHTNPLLIGLH